MMKARAKVSRLMGTIRIRCPIAFACSVLLTVACNSTLRTGRIGSAGAGAGGVAGGEGGAVASVGGVAGGPVIGGGGTAGFAGGGDGGGGMGGGPEISGGGMGGGPEISGGGMGGGPEISGGGMGGGPEISGGGMGGGPVIGGGGTAGFAGGGGTFTRGGAGGRLGGAGGAGPVGGSGGLASGGVAGQTYVGQYGGGTAPSVVASGSEPLDERPVAPAAWTPPFAQSLGTPGWRDSTERICNQNQGRETVSDVWADERGVFALVASACSESMGVPCGKEGATLKLNNGSGWKPYYQYADGSFWETRLWGGFPNGPLVTSWDYYYSLAFIDDQGIARLHGDGSYLGSAFVTGDGMLYIADSLGPALYAAGTWARLAGAGGYLRAIWADSQTVIAAGGGQTVLIGHDAGTLAQLTGVPAGVYSAVWAFGPNDIWFGNTAAQLLHYDGQTWEIHPTGSRDVNGTGGIAQLWGSDGVLYFSTNVEFGRWNGTSAEMLLAPPADAEIGSYPAHFGRFWGTSANDVFVPLRDSRYEQYACGGSFVLWFDGSTFHAF